MTTSVHPVSVNQRWKTLPLEQVLIAAIVALLCLRLVGLLNLPIFVDEAIHIDWTNRTLAGEAVRDAYVVGKTLSIWLWVPFVALPVDPLLTTRLASVLTNVITVICIIGLGNKLYSRRVGFASALVYLLLPYSFFHGRMALVDNFVTTLFAVLLWLTAPAASRRIGLGSVVALIVAATSLGLSKLTGIMALPIPVLGALLLSSPSLRKLNTVRMLIAMSVTCLIVLVFVVQGFGLGEFVQRAPSSPMRNVLVNLGRIASYYWVLLTPPGLLLTILAMWKVVRQRDRIGLWLLAASLLMVLPYLPVANTLFSRYLLPALVPLSLLLGALLMDWFEQDARFWQRALVALTAGWMIVVQLMMVVAIPSAPLPQDDRFQHVSGWPSGYGVPELVDELNRLAQEKPLQVTSLSWWDVTGVGLLPYLPADGQWSVALPNDAPYEADSNRRQVIVVNRTYGAALSELVSRAIAGRELIWSSSRPDGQSGLELWGETH